MPIISRIGRKSPSVRLLYAGIYLVLIAGGLTMLYPFLLMLATSLTDQTDFREFRLIPRYFHDAERRYAEYSDLHAHRYLAFAHVAMPTYRGDPSPPTSKRIDDVTGRELPPRVAIDADWPHLSRRVALWREFQTTLGPGDFGLWHVGRRTLPGKAEMLWRTHLRRVYRGDVRALNRDLGAPGN